MRYDGNMNRPLFVTFNSMETGYEELRGCIGCLDPLKLHPGLQDYSLK